MDIPQIPQIPNTPNIPGMPSGATPPLISELKRAGSRLPGGKPDKKLIIIVVAVVGLAVLGWVGKMVMGSLVSFGARKAFEASTGVQIDEKGGTMTFKGKDGSGTVQIDTNDNSGSYKITDDKGQTVEFAGGNDGKAVKSLPKGFPAEIPVYGGMTIDSTFTMSTSEAQIFTASWNSSESSDKLAEWYSAEIEAKGWKVTGTSSYNSDTNIVFDRGEADAEKKDGGVLTVSAKDDGGSRVGVTVTIVKK